MYIVISRDKIFLLVSKYLSLWLWPSLELVIIGGICVSQTHLVLYWNLFVVCLSVNFSHLLQNHRPTFTKHSWVKGIYIYSNEGPYVLFEGKIIHWRLISQSHWSSFNQTWHKVSLGEGGMKDHSVLKREILMLLLTLFKCRAGIIMFILGTVSHVSNDLARFFNEKFRLLGKAGGQLGGVHN